MRHRIINALPIWLNRIRKEHLRHADPGKIWIDEQDVAVGFKLVAVRSEVGDPHTLRRSVSRIIGYHQLLVIPNPAVQQANG